MHLPSRAKVLLYWLALSGLAPASFATATANVELSVPGKAISPDLVGIFFEDLNHAADGGLYAGYLTNSIRLE